MQSTLALQRRGRKDSDSGYKGKVFATDLLLEDGRWYGSLSLYTMKRLFGLQKYLTVELIGPISIESTDCYQASPLYVITITSLKIDLDILIQSNYWLMRLIGR